MLAAALVATGAAGVPAVSSGSPPSAVVTRTAAVAEGEADWTLMVYDVADTDNIAEYMVRNLAAFAALPPMPNVNVVALVDLPERTDPGAPTSRLPGVGDFSTAKLLVLDGGRWNEIRDLGEISMGRPDALADFIDEVADRFPAEKYGLVLSDHGGGWSGGYTDSGPPWSAHLTIADMRAGMLQGMQRAGIDRFDLLDHDSCLMSSYEVTSALAPLAETMVGSEEIIAGDNTLTLQAMASLGENASAEDWGITNIEEYAKDFDTAPQRAGEFSALSVIDGDRMSLLDAAVESFANVAVEHMDEIAPQVGVARAQALEFVVGRLGPESSFNTVDLGDFLRHLDNLPPEVEVARDAVFAALDNVVVHLVTRRATQQATGLNVFFPGAGVKVRRYFDEHIGPPGWSRFVQAYVETTGQVAENQFATFVSDQATVLEQGRGGIRIAGQLSAGDAANVAETGTEIYTRLDGRDALAGVLPGYLNSGAEDMVQGVWDYSVTSLADDATSVPVSAIYQAQSGGLIGSFSAQYRSPDGEQSDVVFRVLLDSHGEIQNVTISDTTTEDSAAGIELENGGTLTPYLLVPASGSWQSVPSTQSIQVTGALRVDYPQLPAGTRFDMGVVVVDLAGSTDGAFVTETVPEGRAK